MAGAPSGHAAAVGRGVVVLLVLSGALVAGSSGAVAAGPGTITEFNVPTHGSDPLGIAAGPGGTLWVADSNDFDVHKVERFSTAGVMTGAFNVPGGASPSCPQGCVDPAGIVAGPDGNIWFTELTQSANSIGRLDPNGPQGPPGSAVTAYSVPTPNVNPWAITVGRDGNLWFTENIVGGKVGRITPAGAIREFPIPNALGIPFGITSGPDGNLWFTEQANGSAKVGVMATSGAMVTEIAIASSTLDLAGITVGSDGNIWFAAQTANSIGRINPVTKTYLGSVTDAGAGPQSITSGPDGLLYFTEAGSSSIGRFDPRTPPASVTTHFATPTRGAIDPLGPPTGITVGADGNIWFTEGSSKGEGGNAPSPIHNIGRLTLDPATRGAVTLSTTALDFGSRPVGSAGGALGVSLTNSGNAPLVISAASIDGANAGDFAKASDDCGGSAVLPGATCAVAVTFAPGGAGARSATLTIADSAPDSPQRVGLGGTGKGAPGTVPVPGSPPVRGSPPGSPPGTPSVLGVSARRGYWMAASDGGVFNFGSAGFFGSAGAIHLNKPVVGMAATPTGKGYWLVASDGGIFNYGDAAFLGSAGAIHLNSAIGGMAATPAGKGYWLAASDGGIFNYGDAAFHGSAGAVHLNRPIVAMARTPGGNGYWLVASDGGIFNYGDAAFHGSAGGIHLNKPIVGMAAAATGTGYWLAASDGGVFNYGDAAFVGSAGSVRLASPVLQMIAAP